MTVQEEDSPELLDFLLRVYPAVMAELDKSTRSHAFDGYEVDWEESSNSVQCLHTLSHAALEEKLEVTCLSWNPTGAVLAVAYGRYDHQDWCTHKSSLCTWNLDRRSLNANKADLAIDIPSCVMSIAFHPIIPSLILAGTFNGAVYVYDIGKEDDTLIASSGVGENSHKDPISQVMWLNDPASKDKKFKIMSAGGDGKILIWRLSQSSKNLKLLSGFVVQTDSIPRNLRVSKARGDSLVGVTCLSFSHEDKTTFVAGSEGGGVFKCSTNATTTATSEDIQSVPVHSPVTFAFHPYLGPIHSVCCSPHHRNLFLTAGTDTLRLYNMLQLMPSLTIEPSCGYLYSVRWSYTRPVVFAVACGNGKVLLYDLKANRINPVMTLDGCSKGSSIFTAEFNPSRKYLLASGNGRGEVKVWKLNDDLVSHKPRDQDILESLAVLHVD
ncbi:WD repeat-containing 34-like [Paramuricea clavata]|uniref:WD repeat-containing 34-like n=1 Tax=Paramuricea clavata TaxID=317549 RepID=A0A6S7JFA6_PARCT|nr:WD repeat-containing 34-like [Paramuricea clavata]